MAVVVIYIVFCGLFGDWNRIQNWDMFCAFRILRLLLLLLFRLKSGTKFSSWAIIVVVAVVVVVVLSCCRTKLRTWWWVGG